MKNLCAKTRKQDNPYEIWKSPDGTWTWKVLKKYQANDYKPYARWFCAVTSPYTFGSAELGDCYVTEVKNGNTRTYIDTSLPVRAAQTKPEDVRPVAYPKRGKTRTDLGVQQDGKRWEKVTTENSVSVHPIPECEISGTPNPEAFLRGDSLDRFFK